MRLRVATILLAVLCTAGTTPLLAQQPGPAPVMDERLPLPGPRLTREMLPFEPSLSDSRASALPLVAGEGKNHTFVFSTLALVLIAIIVVLLVV